MEGKDAELVMRESASPIPHLCCAMIEWQYYSLTTD